jgi:hypothetical protein
MTNYTQLSLFMVLLIGLCPKGEDDDDTKGDILSASSY